VFQIRVSQLEAARQNQMDMFVQGVVDHVRQDLADRMEANNIAEEAYEEFVRSGIARAGKYEVTIRTDVTFFIECMAIYGPQFDQDPAMPWAREILTRDDLHPVSKMQLIEEHMLFGPGGAV
jgi:hypothetical protein